MILPSFELHEPQTVDEALDLAASVGGDFDFLAGGTDLLPNYKQRLNPRKHVIFLGGIDELTSISGSQIGALVSLSALGEHPVVAERYPGLVEAAATVASPLIRNHATLGGNLLLDTRCYYFNQSHFWREAKGYCLKADGDVCLVVPQKEICYATYSGDTAPVLMCYGADVGLAGPDGRRRVPLRDFFRHDGIARFVKKKNEILTDVRFPDDAPSLRAGYEKLRIRDTIDFPLAGVAAGLRLADDGSIAQLTVVVNATNTTPLVMDAVTDTFAGQPLTAEAAAAIAGQVKDKTTPYRNVWLSPQYRKEMVGVLTERLLLRLATG